MGESIISKYGSLVKFSHTIFAMPFALSAFVYGYTHNDIPFNWVLLIEIILCMVFARNAAMGFNRWADRDIDSANPRTQNREIPRKALSARSVLLFVIINALFFVITAYFINDLAFLLSPLALFVILGYSMVKRFSWWCHVVLGSALSIAPIGAYIAVTGHWAVVPILLSGVVLTWVAGFDIIYSLQDTEFDRNHGLHSVPVKFGIKGALIISGLFHIITIYAVIILGKYMQAGILYQIGQWIFIGLIIYQHIIVTPKRLSRIGLAFGTLNGIGSLIFGLFFILDRLGIL